MGMFTTLNITGSALTAERFRMNIIAQNLANISTTSTENGEPYRRKQVVFQEKQMDFASALETETYKLTNGGVRAVKVVESQADFVPVYDTDHTDAD